jgi:hypothetical protein
MVYATVMPPSRGNAEAVTYPASSNEIEINDITFLIQLEFELPLSVNFAQANKRLICIGLLIVAFMLTWRE